MIPASWLAAALKVAVAYWAPAAACGPVHIRQHVVPRLYAHADPRTAAWTYDGTGPNPAPSFRDGRAPCAIYYYAHIAQPWTFWRVCEATVHEVGHMTGHQHSDDPSSPMFDFLHPIPVCDTFPGSTHHRARAP